MAKTRNIYIYTILTEALKKSLWRLRCKCENNIKTELQETGSRCDYVDWIIDSGQGPLKCTKIRALMALYSYKGKKSN
jgi:hypothetical protein